MTLVRISKIWHEHRLTPDGLRKVRVVETRVLDTDD